MTARALTIGVVIPVFRAEAFIGDCLDAIANQTRLPDQVILIDDRGADASIAVARQHAENLGLKIDIITQPANLGPAAARNVGLSALTTDLVWFCDADDVARPTFIDRLSTALETSTADFAMCRTLRASATLEPLEPIEPSWLPNDEISGQRFVRGVLRTTMRAYACNKIFRLSLLGQDPFPADIKYEDIAPAITYGLKSASVALIHEPLYLYRENDSSISRRFAAHTTDLFTVGSQVRDLILAANLPVTDRQWRQDLLHFHYDGVILPIANMALLAEPQDELTRSAVAAARRGIKWRDFPSILRLKSIRLATAVAVLSISPPLYQRILKLRQPRHAGNRTSKSRATRKQPV